MDKKPCLTSEPLEVNTKTINKKKALFNVLTSRIKPWTYRSKKTMSGFLSVVQAPSQSQGIGDRRQ